MSEAPKTCPKRMWRSGAFHPIPCGKRASGDHGFCAIHSPEAVAKRQAKSRAKYEDEMARDRVKWADAKERERKLAVFPDLLAALKEAVQEQWDSCHAYGDPADPSNTEGGAVLYREWAAVVAKAEGRP